MYMNSFNDEVCEYISTPVTENFVNCGKYRQENALCGTGCSVMWSNVCTYPVKN